MLSLIVGAGSFHMSRIASGGSRPKPASIRPFVHDMSINAIAMDLTDSTIHDPANGQRDLKARVVRVLHESSFIDDPTRIFRAVRLAARRIHDESDGFARL